MPNVYDETFCENTYGLEAVNCFRKKVAGLQTLLKETSAQLVSSEI